MIRVYLGIPWRLAADATDKQFEAHATHVAYAAGLSSEDALSLDPLFWLPEVAQQEVKYPVGDDDMLIVSVSPRRSECCPSGYYVVLEQGGAGWTRLYGPMGTMAEAKRAVRTEIGPSSDLLVLER